MRRVALSLLVLTFGATSAWAKTVKVAARPSKKCKEAAKRTPKKLREVDWCNRDYGSAKSGWRLRAGHGRVHIYPHDMSLPHDTISTKLQDVVYLDVDDDGADEALVVLQRTTWVGGDAEGSTTASISVFRWEGSDAKHMGSLGQLSVPVKTIAVSGGILTVDANGSPQKWQVVGGELVPLE